MKKIVGITAMLMAFWFVGTELMGTASLFQKAKVIPAISTIDSFSQSIVLDSVDKTGLLHRYKYSESQLHKLFSKQKLTIKDTHYIYFYCFKDGMHQAPKSNMSIFALHKSEPEVFLKGNTFFTKKQKILENLSPEKRTAEVLKEIFEITPEEGTCFEIQPE